MIFATAHNFTVNLHIKDAALSHPYPDEGMHPKAEFPDLWEGQPTVESLAGKHVVFCSITDGRQVCKFEHSPVTKEWLPAAIEAILISAARKIAEKIKQNEHQRTD